jgi:hypothetical protein
MHHLFDFDRTDSPSNLASTTATSLAEAEVASCAAARAKRDTMGSRASISLLILLVERVDGLFVSVYYSENWGSHKGGYGPSSTELQEQ